MDIRENIQFLKGVGPKKAQALKKLGIENIYDLITYYPRRYEDQSQIVPIGRIKVGEVVNIQGKIMAMAEKNTRRGLKLLTIMLADDTGVVQLNFFNQDYLKKKLKVQKSSLFVHGKVGYAYVLSGSFATKAYDEAKLLNRGFVAASSKDRDFKHIPTQDEIKLSDNAAYLHLCYNNTIYGTEYHYIPETGDVPLIADMSSDMLSRPLDFSKFSLIYAGAQKNLGPAGVVVVVARKSFLENSPKEVPTMLRYDTYLKKNSLYNTPPAFGIYMVGKVVSWIKANGGLEAMAKKNAAKAKLVYDAIDNSDGFYVGHADKDSRSFMNVTFRLPSEELEAKFAKEALEHGLGGVKGHRSVGGMRTSIYNAMPMEGCQALVDFMEKFRKANK